MFTKVPTFINKIIRNNTGLKNQINITFHKVLEIYLYIR